MLFCETCARRELWLCDNDLCDGLFCGPFSASSNQHEEAPKGEAALLCAACRAALGAGRNIGAVYGAVSAA